MPSRRTTLRALAAGFAALGGCAGGDEPTAGSNSSQATTATTETTTTREPTETTEEPTETTEQQTDAVCDERWEPAVRWSVNTGVRAYAPAVADGVVYFGSQDDHLYAVDAASGEVAWRVEHRGALGGPPPAVHDGAVTYSGYERVTVFDAADATEHWSFAPPGSLGDLARSVADDGGAVYAGASQHPGPNQALQEGEREYDRVYAFDRRTGDRRWRVSLGDRLDGDRTPPKWVTAADGRVFVAVGSGPLVALDARDGTTLWRLDDGYGYNPEVADGVIYGTSDHELAAVDAATGDVLWAAAADRHPAVGDDAVYAADGDTLVARGRSDGRLLWQAAVPDGSPRMPAVAGDIVYLPARRGDGGGPLYAFDAATGCRRGSFEVQSKTPSTPAVAGDTVYVGGLNGDGRMWAVSAP